MIVKNFKDLSLDITEDEYRNLPQRSYSTLAKFNRLGYRELPNLFNKEDTESLRFGSVVDTLLFEPDKVESLYYISDSIGSGSAVSNVISNIYAITSNKYSSLLAVPRDLILDVIKECGYQNNWKDDTRIDKIIHEGKDLFDVFNLAHGKKFISTIDYNDAVSCVESLKSNIFTIPYTHISPLHKHIEFFDQLKFIATIEDTEYKCMIDRIIVDHKKKTITIVDLKTTSGRESDFASSYLHWGYHIQSNLYTRILIEVINQDDFYKDYCVKPFIFMVIGRHTKSPLLYEDVSCYRSVALKTKYKEYKHFSTINTELDWHLNNLEYNYSKEQIYNKGVVNIYELLNKE